MKTWTPRTLCCIGSFLVWAAWLAPPNAALAAGEGRDVQERLFIASDFPRLAEGVDTGLVGEATVFVWAPSEQEWRLESASGNRTLHFQKKPGDTTPRWQALGTVTLARGCRLKVAVSRGAAQQHTGPQLKKSAKTASKDAEKAKTARKDRANSRDAAKRAERPTPVPALLWLAKGASPGAEPVMDLIRGRTESLEPPRDLRRTLVRFNSQGAEFQAPSSADAWRDRARHIREQMLVALGLWPMLPKAPMNPQIYGKLERGDYTIEKVVLETLPGFTVSGNLYRPVGHKGKVPGILCPHGHWTDGRMNPEVQMRCIRWSKLGCVVFMYDMVGYNDSKPFPHTFQSDRLRRWGLSLATLQTWNSIRALDWLASLPDVDAARIGCTGESGGGTQTFLLTALDERVKVSAPVVMVSDTFQGGCECENSPGLRHRTDNVEFAALCAPRPLFLVGATGDWTAKTMERAFPAIRGVYSLLGSTDRASARVFDFPHNYNQTSRNAVYGFMSYWLLGIDDPARTKEGQQRPEKAEDLATFDAKHPAPPGRKTPEQLESYLVASLGRALDDLAPSSSAPRWEAARRLLETSSSARLGIVNPSPHDIAHEEARHITREGLSIVHAEIGRRSAGEAIPVVRLSPGRATGRLTIVAHPRGKAALADDSGNPAALTRELLARGHAVVGFDPLFVGEALDSQNPVAKRPQTDHFETYNPALAADQMQDLATVLSWARAEAHAREVNLVAQDLAGPQVLLARPMLEGLARTVIELKSLPDPAGSGSFPAPLDLPGMFQFGGFKAAAALAAPAPLWIHGAPPAFEACWPRTAYALCGAGHLLRIEPRDPSVKQIADWLDRGE